MIDFSLSHHSPSFGLFMKVRLHGTVLEVSEKRRKRKKALRQARKTSAASPVFRSGEEIKHPGRHSNCSLCDWCMPLERERAARHSSKVFQDSCSVRGSLSGGMPMISHRLSRCLSSWQESEEDSRGVLPVFERRGRPGIVAASTAGTREGDRCRGKVPRQVSGIGGS